MNRGDWAGLSENRVVGREGGFSLCCSSSVRIGFSAIEQISKSLKVKKVNGISIARGNTESMLKTRSAQWNLIYSRSDIWYPLMSISCEPTLESTSSRVSIVPSGREVIETRARWLFKKSCSWDNNKFQAAREFSWELIAISWTRSCSVRVTESGSKSRDHSIPLLETEKIMLLYCRLEVYRIKLGMNFCITTSTNGNSTRLCHKWIDFCLFWLWFGYASLWLVVIFLQKWRWFSFSVVTTRLF